MAKNKIKIFAENANIGQTITDGSDGDFYVPGTVDYNNGFVLSDDLYVNREDRKSGFKPQTPASSVTMNTALRQCSVMANILSEVIASNNLITPDGITVHPDNVQDNGADYVNENGIQEHAMEVSKQLTKYLMQINNLRYGQTTAAKASYAENYLEEGTIHDEFKKIQNGTTVCATARNYVFTNEEGKVIKNTDGTYDSFSIEARLSDVIDLCNYLESIGVRDKINYIQYNETDSNLVTFEPDWSGTYIISKQGLLCLVDELIINNKVNTSFKGTAKLLKFDGLKQETTDIIPFRCEASLHIHIGAGILEKEDSDYRISLYGYIQNNELLLSIPEQVYLWDGTYNVIALNWAKINNLGWKLSNNL